MRSLSRAESFTSRDSVFEKRGRAMGNVLPAGAEDESASRKSVRAAFSLGRNPRWSGPASSPWRNSRRAGTCIGAAVAKRSPRAPSSGRHLCWGGISPKTEALVGGNPSPAATSFPGVRAGGGIPVGAAARRAVRFVPAVIRLPVFRQHEPFRRMPER